LLVITESSSGTRNGAAMSGRYALPYNNFKFTEEYIVQRLSSNTFDKTARVPEPVEGQRVTIRFTDVCIA